MTYEETIAYLYRQLPMFSRIGAAAYKKDLHNTIQLCASLNNPQQQFKTIHIAGTNGKGSVSSMLAAILQQAGYKTGLYTSPHIKDFRERIRVNGEMVSREFIVDFVERTREITTQIEPSFFELTVAMAFDYFAKEQVDIAVIETGLGGRLDSTNIISPVLSVITNIGFDHMNMLGNTLSAIAFEKAGIIKQDTPVVIGDSLPETLPVFMKKANEVNASLHLSSDEYITEFIESTPGFLLCNIRDQQKNTVEKIRLGLTGLYQAKNICTVLSSVAILRKQGYHITEQSLHNGIENTPAITGLKGRWQILKNNPTIIADVGHNEDGIKAILQQLQLNYPKATYHFVLGFVNDKDLGQVLTLFPPNARYYFTQAHIPRALNKEILQDQAATCMLEGECFENVNKAIQQAVRNASKEDVIMVCGSFFIIAEIEEDQISVLSAKY